MTIDPIEIAWITVALLGMAGSLFNLRELMFDWQAAPARLRLMALMLIRAELLRLLSLTCFFLAGIGAAWEWGRLAVIVTLILGAVLIMVNTWWDRVDRHRLIHLNDHRDALRDPGRDEGRDLIRDEARDIARDAETELP